MGGVKWLGPVNIERMMLMFHQASLKGSLNHTKENNDICVCAIKVLQQIMIRSIIYEMPKQISFTEDAIIIKRSDNPSTCLPRSF
jgi:hypothetical protein